MTNTKEQQIIEFRNKLGRKYRESEFATENTEYIKKAYREIVRVNNELFEKIPYKVIEVDYEPYENAKEMRERVCREGIIYISSSGEPNEYMTKEENFKGRAVHDVYAHMVCGCPFTFQGEYNAFLEQSKLYPSWLKNTLFSEIPMQTASYYVTKNFDYEQRAFEAPNELVNEAEQLLKKDYSKNAVICFL